MKFLALVLCTMLSFAFAECPCKKNVQVLQQDTPTEETWGYHLILDCKGCNLDKISCSCNLSAFVKMLTDEIGMLRFGEPIVEHLDTDNPETAGYSLVQLIEASSITGHFVDKNGDAYIDIVSSKPFNYQTAVKVVKDFLEPQNIKLRFLARKA